MRLDSPLPYTRKALFVYETWYFRLSYTREAVFVYETNFLGKQYINMESFT